MRLLSWKTLALSVILLGGSPQAFANHETFVIGEIYTIRMTGCITRGLADIVVEKAKTTGSGYDAYQIGVNYGVCGPTVGQTRFLEAIESFTEPENVSHPDIWYVRYEVEQDDGSWMPFWGFTILRPEGKPEISKSQFKCGNDCV